MNWSFCHPRLAIGGGECTPDEVHALAADGITHIISHRQKQESCLAEHPKMMLLWNPCVDDGTPRAVEWFEKSIGFASWVFSSFTDIPGTIPLNKLYVHCYHGSNRSASTAVAILMALRNPFDEALAMVLKARPNAEIRYREDARRAVKELGYVRS